MGFSSGLFVRVRAWGWGAGDHGAAASMGSMAMLGVVRRSWGAGSGAVMVGGGIFMAGMTRGPFLGAASMMVTVGSLSVHPVV